MSGVDLALAIEALREAIAKAEEEVEAFVKRLPAAAQPAPGQIATFFDTHVMGAGIAALQSILAGEVRQQFISLFLTGRGPIERDDSALS